MLACVSTVLFSLVRCCLVQTLSLEQDFFLCDPERISNNIKDKAFLKAEAGEGCWHTNSSDSVSVDLGRWLVFHFHLRRYYVLDLEHQV